MRKHYTARKYQKRFAPFNDKANGIRIDLITDYDGILSKWVDDFVDVRKSPDDGVLDFFRLQKRLIIPKPRKILKAADFLCPEGYEDKLDYLEMCIVQGKSLIPFLSKLIKNLKCEDMMLYDWGIYHLHISDVPDEKDPTFMERSQYLLMVYVTDETVYFLKVVPHEKPSATQNIWVDKDYIRILEENWPGVLKRYKMSELMLEYHITEREQYELRKAGITTMTEINDDVLFSPGGGYASDCSSIEVVRARDDWLRRIEDLERIWVYEWGPAVLNQYKQAGYEMNFMDISMISCDDNRFLFIEKGTGLLFVVEYHGDSWSVKSVSFGRTRMGGY